MAIQKQTWIQANLGKVLLAGSIVIVLIYALSVVAGQGDSKSAVDEVAKVSATLGKRIEETTKRPPKIEPPPLETIVGDWDLKIPARDDLPMWLFNRPPEIQAIEVQPVDKRPDLFGPVDLAAEVSKDFTVELKWKADARTTAKVEGYDVLRWVKGGKKPEKPIEDRLIKSTMILDDDYGCLMPLTTVIYMVRVHTKEDVKQGAKLVESAPLEVTIPDDRTVLYHGRGTVEMAVLNVRRFCYGDWKEEEFPVYLGSPIGGEKVVSIDGGAKKVKVNFDTGKLLGEIGEEETVEEIVTWVPKRDEKGRPEYDEDGKEKKEKKVRKVKVIKPFVLLVDDKGNGEKIYKTKPEVRKLEGPSPSAPYIDHRIFKLEERRATAKNVIRKILGRRVVHLKRARKRLIGTPEEVDDNLLNEKDGLLYELRWEWLKAKDQEARFPKNRKKKEIAEELTWRVKDLEHFLSPKGWDKEEKEWERDREEASDHKDFEDRPPAIWAMAERPKAPIPNLMGGTEKGPKKPGKKDEKPGKEEEREKR
ncbi:MAG: hypothetical protein ACYS47_00470 [Planctomycetota bacterium]|jgi:hypothetical protein